MAGSMQYTISAAPISSSLRGFPIITIISGSMRIRTKSKTSFTRYPSTPQIPISSPSMGITATDRLKVPITLLVKSIAVITSSRTQIRNPAAAASRFFFHPKLRNIPKRSFKFFSVFISNFLIILYERQARDSIHRLFCRLLKFRRSPDVCKSSTAGSCLVFRMLSYSREIVFLRNRSDAAGPDSRYGSRYSFQMFANSVILGYAYTMIATVAIHTDTVKTIIFAPLSVAK